MGASKFKPTSMDMARDELFSHIRRCGVLEAESAERTEWMRDTVGYLGERYPDLSEGDLAQLAEIGLRYCEPVIPHGPVDLDGDEARA